MSKEFDTDIEDVLAAYDRYHQHNEDEVLRAVMLRCDKRRREIELFEDPDPGFLEEGPAFRPTWHVDEVTRDNLRARVLPMIREALSPPGHVFMARGTGPNLRESVPS